MPSDKSYLDFILEQLSGLEGLSFKPMMGEFLLYYRQKIIGGIYDNRLLVKPIPAAVKLMPQASLEIPYEGAKAMLLVDCVDNRESMRHLIESMYDELPLPTKKKG